MRLIDADELKSKLSDKDYITYTHEYGNAIPVEWIMSAIDNAPTVEQECYITGAQWDEFMKEYRRTKGERAERALAIIDRLRTDGHINNKEQGTLRRAILLPERPRGEWLSNANGYMGVNFGRKCSLCGKTVEFSENFCPNCGAYMRGDNNE